ncbi:1,4-dihydroxy-2-naphthoate octaprenyltransferase [Pilibacter termitis]|uniref:1,4-dihydroxy-2-naphthoate octaprenyltransferase n=2 Tax=Pilibacter termitis TaxID=263852 RepID=A0A1T4MJG1_9ENTE|nr:1,4-dihydroxy-2-naphthoate octaprenyltransferase [Pilibacter termitis]
MTKKQFVELTEIYNLPINFFLFIIGMSYSLANFHVFFNWRVVLFACVLSLIYIATNIHNNYHDFQNAKLVSYKEKSNIIGRENLNLSLVRQYMTFFFALAFILGAILVYFTDFPTLLLGSFGFFVAWKYSAGKFSIHSTPLAETLPAFMSGVSIPMITAHMASFNVKNTPFFEWRMFLVFLPAMLCVLIGLLCNNTCDLEEDIENGRKTLVYYIGKKVAVFLLNILYLVIFCLMIVNVLLGFLPFLAIFALLLAILPTLRALKIYQSLQSKKETYPLIMKSISIFLMSYALFYFLGVVF